MAMLTPRVEIATFHRGLGIFTAATTRPTTYLSDGGETVRIAQGEFRAFGEPILDWFHIAMRMTVLTQTLKGVPFRAP
jgi:hypothetical protein